LASAPSATSPEIDDGTTAEAALIWLVSADSWV